MGAWGYYDDQNDSVHDQWYRLFDQLKNINIKKVDVITKKTYKLIEENLVGDDCIGIFLLMLEYLNCDDLSNDFSNHKPKKEIDPMQRYHISHPELVNKKLLKKILSHVNGQLEYKRYKDGWKNPQARKKALCNEKKLFLEMLNTN